MIPINKENTENVLSFLIGVYNNIKDGKSANMRHFTDTLKLPQHSAKVLTEGGIVASNGKKGLGARFNWLSKYPDEQMAIEMLRRINSYKHSYTPKKAKELPPVIVKREPILTAAIPATESDKDCLQIAIDLLKSHGYKIQKPVYVEV